MQATRTRSQTAQRVIVLVAAIAGAVVFAAVVINRLQPAQDRANLGELNARLAQRIELYRHATTQERQKLLRELKRIGEQRREKFLTLMETDPAGALAAAIAPASAAEIPNEIRSYFERPVMHDGLVQVVHSDDFAHRRSSTEYFLLTQGGQRLALRFAGSKPDILTGTTATVRGLQLEATIAVPDSPEAFSISGTPSPSVAPSTKKVAVILANFLSDRTQPFTADRMRQLVFTDTRSPNSYFHELTFTTWSLRGKLRADGDVFGWYTLPYNTSPCDYWAWATAADAAATNAGVDLSGYDNYVYILPAANASCAVGGRAEIGGRRAWIFSVDHHVITHELGHNFGAHHGHSLRCTSGASRVPISETCTTDEYGDIFDVMGMSFYQRHMDASHQEILGLYGPGRVVDATLEGDYVIAPLGTFSQAPKALRIPRSASPGVPAGWYYVEYRKPDGVFDNFTSTDPVVNGLSIRIVSGGETWLIDTTPGSNPDSYLDFFDGSLGAGRTFFDAGKSIAITALQLDGIAFIRISFTCTHHPATATLTPTERWGTPGTTAHYTLAVQNNDTGACGDSTVSVNPTLPARWVQGPAIASQILAPYQTSTWTLSVTSPGITIRNQQPSPDRAPEIESAAAPLPADGTYPIAETVTTTPLNKPAESTTVQTTYTLDSTPPAVRIDAPVAGAVITAGNGSIEIRAAATDATSGVIRMEILVNNTSVAVCGAGSCSTSITPAAGVNQITVTATDRAGTTGLATSTFEKLGSKSPPPQEYTPEP